MITKRLHKLNKNNPRHSGIKNPALKKISRKVKQIQWSYKQTNIIIIKIIQKTWQIFSNLVKQFTGYFKKKKIIYIYIYITDTKM